jgi:hypothetical protein
MNETLPITKFKTCFGCNYQAETTETKCPNCQKPLQDESTIRVLGWLLVFIGVLLVSVMGSIMLWMNTVMHNRSSTSKWTGSPEQAQIGLLVMGVVMIFGFSAFIAGFWQVMTGKRNLKLIWLMLGLGVALMVLVRVIQFLF